MPRTPIGFVAAALTGLIALSGHPASGQDGGESLRLQGLTPGGLRSSVTESRDALTFTVLNPGPAGRDARVVFFYSGRAGEQFARDVWVPGRAALTTWLPVGPAPAQKAELGREMQSLLYDRTDGQDRLVLPPGEERVRSRIVLYRPRSVTTALIVDGPVEGEEDGLARRRALRAERANQLTRSARAAIGLHEPISLVHSATLPPTPDAFEGVDQIVLAGNSLADDPVGRTALRQWVERGGRLWVMLDLLDPEGAAAILGDGFEVHVVDRVGLTSIRLHRPSDDPKHATPREIEEPVELVRVALSGSERVQHVANGWPAAFTRPLGRGVVLFTTLGGPGWHRPRTERDRAPPAGTKSEDVPVALPSLEELAQVVTSRPEPHRFTAEDFRPLLTEEIGYTIPGRGTAAAIFGAFALALVGLGLGLRRSRRPELVGWFGPAAAVVAAGVFATLGLAGRRAVPATAAAAALVEIVPGTGEAAVDGLFAVYRPDSGPLPLASSHGASLDIDTEGLEGQTRRRVQTDVGAWHWEGLAIPAGVRSGPFRDTIRVGPTTAVLRFGPAGVEGRLSVPGFRGLADALALTAARNPIALQLESDGRFTTGLDDGLPPGQFLAGTVLSDAQQHRQEVYRKLLTASPPQHLDGRDLLFAWGEPEGFPFVPGEATRTVGTALLAVPLSFEPSPRDTSVTIPRSFVAYRRIFEDRAVQPTLESAHPIEMHLRFQVPAAVLPMRVERAVLHARVRSAGRLFTVFGVADGATGSLLAVDNPAEPIRLEITDERYLRLDERGGLHLHVKLSGASDTGWKIESLGLDVFGRTTPP